MLNIRNENFYLGRSEIESRNSKLKVGRIGVEIVDHMPKLASEPGGLLLFFHSSSFLLE